MSNPSSTAAAADEPKARYFDLVGHPETLKTKLGAPVPEYDYKDLLETKEARVPHEWDVSIGDVLNCSPHLAKEAFFVLQDRTLLKNPDLSTGGYLTIPFAVTKNTRNALYRYEDVIKGVGANQVTNIELHPQDEFIRKNWGDMPEKVLKGNYRFTYDFVEDLLHVTVPDTNRSKAFQKGSTTVKDIQAWYDE